MLHPFMLAGLAGLALPIVIHLINRRRLKPQVLATLQFLEPQEVANTFAPRPRDVLQLLLRLALLVAFVLLMTRFVGGSGSPGPRTLAVVLDASLSMQRKTADGAGSRFDVAKARLLELIDGLTDKDRMSVALVGDSVIEQTGFLDDRAELRRIVEKWTVTDGGGAAVVPALREAVGRLAGRREPDACVLVFSDHQAVNFAPHTGTDDPAGAAFRTAMAQGRLRVFLIDDPAGEGANLSVVQAAFHPGSAYVGGSARLTADVRNHSDKPQSINVKFFEGEIAGRTRPLALAAGETARIDLVHRFDAPADSVCRVELDDDILPADSRFFVPMRIRDRRQVLLVAPPAGDRAGELTPKPADLLAAALNPGEMLGRGSGTNVSVRRVTPALLGRVSLPLYSAIVIHGVLDLPPQSIKDLAAYVNGGGGVWLVPDDEASPLRFNETFAPLLGGMGIGASKNAEPVQSIARTEAAADHPLLAPLLRDEWGDARELNFARYFRVNAIGNAQTVLRAGDNDPLALIVAVGRGRTFVQLFSGSLETGSAARSAVFVPLVQHVLGFLADRGRRAGDDLLRVGDLRRIEVPEFRGLKGAVKAEGPDPRSFEPVGPEGAEIRAEGFLRAGGYELTHPQKKIGRPRRFAVNATPAESDEGVADDAAIQAVAGTTGIERLPYTQLAAKFAGGSEIVTPVVLLLLLAFAAEAVAGAWQSRRKTLGSQEARP